MIARLLIAKQPDLRVGEIEKILSNENFSNPHPDLLYFPADSKLGIEQARQIKDHFSLKPYSAKGRIVVLEDASALTIEAQNSLLKTLEEPPLDAILILAAPSDAKLLPTILSRCQIIRIPDTSTQPIPSMGKLQELSIEKRFEYIEKLKEKKEFLHELTLYFRQKLPTEKEFVKELLQAEQWAEQNVNIRAILEYLMLVMPRKI